MIDEEGMDHGGCPTMTEVCATNWHVAINQNSEEENVKRNIMARGTMMDTDDDRSIGTT